MSSKEGVVIGRKAERLPRSSVLLFRAHDLPTSRHDHGARFRLVDGASLAAISVTGTHVCGTGRGGGSAVNRTTSEQLTRARAAQRGYRAARWVVQSTRWWRQAAAARQRQGDVERVEVVLVLVPEGEEEPGAGARRHQRRHHAVGLPDLVAPSRAARWVHSSVRASAASGPWFLVKGEKVRGSVRPSVPHRTMSGMSPLAAAARTLRANIEKRNATK